MDLLEDYVNHSSHFPTWCSSLAADLLRNAQGRPSVHLQVLPGQSIQHRALSGLALHAFIVLSSPNGHRLLEPLRLILTEPQRMNVSRESVLATSVLCGGTGTVNRTLTFLLCQKTFIWKLGVWFKGPGGTVSNPTVDLFNRLS